MASWLAAGSVAAGAAMALLAPAVARHYVRKARNDHSRRTARWLEDYGGIEGSDKHLAFVTGRRAYLMTAALKR